MALRPPDPDCARAAAALARGDLDAAARAYRKAIRRGIKDPDAHHNLGVIAAQAGDFEAAVPLFRKAISLGAASADARANLAGALAGRGAEHYKAGRFEEAVQDFQGAAELEPRSARSWAELGAAVAAAGRRAEALDFYRKAIDLAPDYAPAYCDLGAALLSFKRFEEAAVALERACALAPQDHKAAINLAAVQEKRGKLVQAEEAGRRAIALAPQSAEAHNNLGMALSAQGEYAESQRHFREAVALAPENAGYLSGLLLHLNYDPTLAPEAVLAEHRRFQTRFGGAPAARPASARRSGRLRVGYISPDFRRHSVSYFIEPVLRAHDRGVVEVRCYSDVIAPDEVTQRLSALPEAWRATAGMRDVQLRPLLESEELDVLVELSGHTAGSRLTLLAGRAAPVQFSYLGYPASTGLDAMDGRVTDDIADPPGHSDQWHSEELFRLEGGFLCYQPPFGENDGPAVVPPPALAGSGVTFGSFNNLAKVNPGVVEAWARLLERVPGARLLVKSRGLDDERLRERIWARFRQHGIGPERVSLSSWVGGTAEHLASYGQVDVALDTFPYNGTTTTCEALWMGVPVVSFAGQVHAGRVGASLLSRVGLPELAPATLEESLAAAAGLAADRDRLAELRRTMRERLRASPLMDAARLARQLEAAYERARAARQA
jgi:protein O-GlcNAc transferase